MNVKFKYISIYLNVILIHFDSNIVSGIPRYLDNNPGDVRVRRQAGYVYDKPTVSFDLPTATSIATTQAPNVDRIQMQMYYAYPVPAVGAGDTVNIGQQNIGSSAGSTAVTSSANGYSYGAQNTQVTDTRSTIITETQNVVNSAYQNNGVTGTQAVINPGSIGYGDGRPASVSSSGATGGSLSTGTSQTQNIVNNGYQNTAVTGNQAVVSSGSTGYGDGRPTSVSITGSTGESVSTNAPQYLPPSSVDNAVGVNIATSSQARTSSTITQPSESYIPSSVQVSSSQNDQSLTITQSAADTSSPLANPDTSYLQPIPESVPKVTIQKETVQSVPNVPTKQYLPSIESQVGQKSIQGAVAAPASVYLPPVF